MDLFESFIYDELFLKNALKIYYIERRETLGFYTLVYSKALHKEEL